MSSWQQVYDALGITREDERFWRAVLRSETAPAAPVSIFDRSPLEVFGLMCDIATASELVEGEQSQGVWRVRHCGAMLDAVLKGEKQSSLHSHDLLGWHADLFPYGGCWRTCDAHIKGMDYQPPAPQVIPIEVKQFCDTANWWMLFSSEAPLYRLAFLHLAFERLHPFTDGNGRIGRLILNYNAAFLRTSLIKVDPPHREAYIAALEAGNVRGLAALFADCQVCLPL